MIMVFIYKSNLHIIIRIIFPDGNIIQAKDGGNHITRFVEYGVCIMQKF